MVDATTIHTIERVLSSLRPMIHGDGGDITFVKMEAGIVYVKLQGACIGCPSSLMTLKFGIESALKAELPEVKEVIPL
jgi:Fe-S cluster biogenesis protein NfuA